MRDEHVIRAKGRGVDESVEQEEMDEREWRRRREDWDDRAE